MTKLHVGITAMLCTTLLLLACTREADESTTAVSDTQVHDAEVVANKTAAKEEVRPG